MALNIALCCSNKLFAEGLKNLLEGFDREVNVVGIFLGKTSLKELRAVRDVGSDLVLFDSHENLFMMMNSPDFFEIHNLKVLLIGDRQLPYFTGGHLRRLVLKGLVGILPPSADSHLLRKALRAVASDELYVDRQTMMKLLNEIKQASDRARLAPREQEIITHICQGYTNKEIAQKMKISEQTVKSHCHRIYKKIGVTDRLQLALYWQKMNLCGIERS
jgi:RNA polymerase sigma factor (sigma-70 family)